MIVRKISTNDISLSNTWKWPQVLGTRSNMKLGSTLMIILHEVGVQMQLIMEINALDPHLLPTDL